MISEHEYWHDALLSVLALTPPLYIGLWRTLELRAYSAINPALAVVCMCSHVCYRIDNTRGATIPIAVTEIGENRQCYTIA